MAKYAKLLLGCYRTGEANDEEVYTGAVIAVLSDYPIDVIERVVDPRTGIPSKINWLPTIAEIKDECEHIDAPQRHRREWEAGAAKQLAERETLAIEHQQPRKTYEQLAADFAEIGIIIGPKTKPTNAVDIAKLLEKYSVSKEQWDAIPTREQDRERRRKQGLPTE